MSKILTAQNAEILTASITIKSLTVERRQVTLAVFRQLLVEDIVDWNQIALRGVGWGHVRYLIEGDPKDAVHLVWQKGSELRRCIVTKNPEFKRHPATHESYEAMFFGDARQGDRLRNYYRKYRPGFINWGGRTYSVDIDDLDVKAVCGESGSAPEWRHNCVQVIENYLRQCATALVALEREIEALRSRHAVLVLPLFDLPQLFIAV